MKLGAMVYFKHEGVLKTGFVRKDLGDDLIIISEDIAYTVKAWKIKRMPNEEKEN